MIVDTSGLLAFFNDREPAHQATNTAVAASGGPFVVSPFVVAELDYLLPARYGVDAELAALTELSGGSWDLAQIDADDMRRIAEIVEKYRDQDIGVTDASLVLLADRVGTREILTLDHRHFSVLRPLGGGRFHLLP